MVKKLFCATRFGIGAKIVEVEVAIQRGLPSFVITGLAGSSIQEAKQRIIGALMSIGHTNPISKVTVNLAPSDIHKNGSHFDLSIALVISLYNDDVNFSNWFAFGELGLDGSIRDVNSIYPLLLDISILHPNSNVILPKSGEKLYSPITGINIYYAGNIVEAINIIRSPCNKSKQRDFEFKSIEIDSNRYYYSDYFPLDFYDVNGQDRAKRAALIAAYGMHNIIFDGSPGCGKSMIAKRMQYILPPMSFNEICECVKIATLGNLPRDYSPVRPFRNPHQSSSKSSILGSILHNEACPGEISLSHNGILFFDELLNFPRSILESLREPLENNELVISRVSLKFTYPASVLFVGAMNPCPCGNRYSSVKECRCRDLDIRRYRNKLSEPLLDRVDLFVKMDEGIGNSKISSRELFDNVKNAFYLQKKRSQSKPNGKLSDSEVDRFCLLNIESRKILDDATKKFGLSYRSRIKIIKLSRSIADLSISNDIKTEHLLEALSFRDT